MPYKTLQWPPTVYPGEVDAECPEAKAAIVVLITKMREQGPQPEGYKIKSLGQQLGGLWQVNLKIENKHTRILYAPDGKEIVFFRIHRKSSPQEQQRAYVLAMERKAEYEERKRQLERAQDQNGRGRKN